jgi:hypothetical protein
MTRSSRRMTTRFRPMNARSTTTTPTVTTMALALAVSWGTMFVHNTASLPIAPWAIENIGPLLFALLLLILYQARPGWRRLVLITILVWGLLNAIVGGVLTVLPLPTWPFEPEQSISHYTAHIIYTLGQLLLIVLAFVGLRAGHGVRKAGPS